MQAVSQNLKIKENLAEKLLKITFFRFNKIIIIFPLKILAIIAVLLYLFTIGLFRIALGYNSINQLLLGWAYSAMYLGIIVSHG